MKEKTLNINFDEENRTLRMVRTSTVGDETEQRQADVRWTKPGDFIACGASALLIRHLAVEKFKGCIQSWTCTIDGDFCVAQQLFHQPEMTAMPTINKTAEVQRVDQLLTADGGKVVKTSSFLLAGAGNLLKEVSSPLPLVFHLSPMSGLSPPRFLKNLRENFLNDVRMMSIYLDYKLQRMDELKQQLGRPPIRHVLRDYLILLMKTKPTSVMNFTVDFVRKLERDGNVQVRQTADRRHQQN